MSKFDAVYKKIEEALPPMASQQPINQPVQQQTPQQQQQAVQQAAKLLNMDPKILQSILDTQQQQQQQQKQAPQTQTAVNTNNQ
jgi:hypothetical protein